MAAEECPLLCVASAEFDIDKGNTLSHVYPSDYDFRQFSQTNIADLCLPDGAHIHTEDWTYLFLHKNSTSEDIKSHSTAQLPSGASEPALGSSGGSSPTPPVEIVYGFAFYKKKADTTVKRGAVQKSILFISTKPAYALYEPLIRATVDQLLETGDKNTMRKMFEAVQKHWGKTKTFSLWDRIFSLTPPRDLPGTTAKKTGEPVSSVGKGAGTGTGTGTVTVTTTSDVQEIVSTAAVKGGPAPPLGVLRFEPDEFDGASLSDVVNRFGVDTMYLWYTLLLEQRILFAGQPAHLVGQCCLACSLLVAPLKGFAKYIYPYVALTDLGPLEKDSVYIAGTTNQLLETKTEWYDMMASFSTGIVRKSNAKLSTLDKEFILNVMSGMHAGEKWVRDQFRNYTISFLESVRTGQYLSQQHEALGEPFKLSPLYERYLSELATLGLDTSSKAHIQALDALRAEGLHMNDHKKKQYLWDLLQKLVDLQSIDEVCQLDGLAAIAPLLNDNSAQVRKYAVAILAQMAISIKGQISLVQNSLIPRVVLMLRDPMPNVASAAAYCLYKISTLYIGVCALVQSRVPKILLNMICSDEDNLVLKISAVETLKQIYLLDPTCPIVGKDNVKQVLRHSSDLQFKSLLCQLLDLWGEDRVPVKVSEAIQLSIASLRGSVGMDVRTSTTSMLLSDISQDPLLLLEFIAAGGVQLVLSNIRDTDRREPLARLSMAILCIMADASMGRAAINGQNVVKDIVNEVDSSDYPLYLYYVFRFFEVCCQHKSTTKQFLANGGLPKVLDAINMYADKPMLRTLMLPCLGALKWLMLLNKSIAEPLASQLQGLKDVYGIIAATMETTSSADVNVAEEELFMLRMVIELYDPKFVRTTILSSDDAELTELLSESEEVLRSRSRSVSPIERAAQRAPRTIEDPSKVASKHARRRSMNLKTDLIQEADSILGELEATVKPPNPTQNYDGDDTESSEMDSEVDQFLLTGTRVSMERRGTISFSDRSAFAAALQLDLSDIDMITAQIADEALTSRVKESKEAASAGGGSSAAGSADDDDDDLEAIVNKMLSDTPRNKIAPVPAPTPSSATDDSGIDIDDLDSLASELLESSNRSSKKDKRMSAPVTFHSAVTATGLVDLIDEADEGLHVPKGTTKGFSDPKPVAAHADPKWDDLDSLTDDLLSEKPATAAPSLTGSAPQLSSPRSTQLGSDAVVKAVAEPTSTSSPAIAGSTSTESSSTRQRQHGRQKSGGEKVSFLIPSPASGAGTNGESAAADNSSLSSLLEDSSDSSKIKHRSKDKDKDKDKEKDKEKEKEKEKRRDKDKEKEKEKEKDKEKEPSDSSGSGRHSPSKRRSREIKFAITTPAATATATAAAAPAATDTTIPTPASQERPPSPHKKPQQQHSGGGSSGSGSLDELDAMVDQLLDL